MYATAVANLTRIKVTAALPLTLYRRRQLGSKDMSYTSRTSSPNERVVYRTAYHWLYWLSGAALALSPLLTFLALRNGTAFGAGVLLVTTILCAIGLRILITAKSTEIAITSDRFILKSGLISFAAEDMCLDKIEEVTLDEGLLGAVLNYGTVKVCGSGGSAILVKMVWAPQRLVHEIDAARSMGRLSKAA